MTKLPSLHDLQIISKDSSTANMFESPTKEHTPAASDAKASSDAAIPTFTEKEERILKVAWLCLKSGAPDVDLKKLTKLGGFNTEKTASNTWGSIKKKLNAMAPKDDGDGDGDGGTTPVAKPKTTPRKRGKKADNEDGDGEADGSPAKKPKTRKTPAKKVKKEEEAEEEAE